MFRNQYDTDVTTWSPQGRLFQVEYAMEAVKQGSACVGLRSQSHAVLAAVNKPASELSSYQRKVFRVAEHAGVALAGLTADGRVLSRFLRNECINHSFVYEAPLPVSRLALRLADKAQVRSSRCASRDPFFSYEPRVDSEKLGFPWFDSSYESGSELQFVRVLS